MRGATGSVAGRRGLVPKPAAADNVKYLKGDGTWSALSNASAATDAEASAGTSTTTFVTPANAGLAGAKVSNARAPRQGLAFNGSAVSATATLGSAIDTSDASIEFEIDVPTANPSATKTAFHLASGRSEGTAYEIAISLLTNGQLIFFLRGVTGGDSRYAGITSNLVTTWGGQRIKGMVTRTGATLAIKINDVTVAYTEVTAGTPPAWSVAWTGTLLTLGQHGVSYSWDGFLAIRIWNRLLTAAEQTSLYQTGAPAAGDYRDPAQPFGTSLVTGNNSNFAGAGSWSGSGVTVSGGQMTITGYALLYSAGVIKGRRYRMVMDVVSNPTTIIFDDGGLTRYATITGTGSKAVDFVCGNGALVELFPTAGGTMVIDNFTIYPIGLLCAPEATAPGNGYQWKDMSGNMADIILPDSGVSWALPDRKPNSIRKTITWTGTNETKAFSPISLLPANAILTLITTKATATHSGGAGVSIGSSNAPTRFVSGGTYTTAKKVHAIANVLPAADTAGDRILVMTPDSAPYTGAITGELHYQITEGNP